MTSNSFDSMTVNQQDVNQPAIPTNFLQPAMENYCQYGRVHTQENIFPPVEQVVQLTNCALYPPNPNEQGRTATERPLGCKTVFVDGLPEKITEEIIKEIFQLCGTGKTIRLLEGKSSHISFPEERFVENKIYFSGYTLKIENKDEAPCTGTLHVDYAQTSDGMHDSRCEQQAPQCQAGHQEVDHNRPPIPPTVHYTDDEASLISEKLKKENTFTFSASSLISLIENGECSRESAKIFFAMIQNAHELTMKLLNDGIKDEKEFKEAKKMCKKQLKERMLQLFSVEDIIKAVSIPKCLMRFSEDQRKAIEMWTKQAEECKGPRQLVINKGKDQKIEIGDTDETFSEEDDENSHML